MTSFGFFSIVVQSPRRDGGTLAGERATIMVRSRHAKDLREFSKRMSPARRDALAKQPAGGISSTPHNDYPFRLFVSRGDVRRVLAQAATDLDYGNFKSAVAKKNAARAHTYHNVWYALAKGAREDEPE